VLGVRMQSAMAYTLTEIKRTANAEIDLEAIPRDDKDTYAMIRQARTLGCFQIESPGQRELVKKLAPENVSDLIVEISLFRPRPGQLGHDLAVPACPAQPPAAALSARGADRRAAGDRGSGRLPRAGAADHRHDDRLRPGRS